MEIAVVGGGSAGLVTAWLLDEDHRVTIFEGQPLLGGHVRTLGGNVPITHLPPDHRLDAGVLLFERHNFPAFHQLMSRLGVRLRGVPGLTTMSLGRAGVWLSPDCIRRLPRPLQLASWPRVLPLALERRRFLARVAGVPDEELYARPVGDYLDGGVLSTWMRLLLMYAYSTPFERTPELPAALAVPMLRGHILGGAWTAIVGGTWTYLARLLAGLRARVHVATPVLGITRRRRRVVVHLGDGSEPSFDRVVLATPPGEILPLLLDADEAEERRFADWSTRVVRTVVHRDDGPYRARNLPTRTEFDLLRTGADHGYNACLNGICGLGGGPPWYGLAFRLEDELDREQILHTQEHATPCYTVAALRHREEVIRTQPWRGVYYAGAWLGDGLQEGAVRSALRVSRLLGGRQL